MFLVFLVFFDSFAIDFVNENNPLTDAINRSEDIPQSIKLGRPKRNLPECMILDNWVFGNFILADEPFEKASWIF